MQDLSISLIQANLYWEDSRRNLDRFEERMLPLRQKQDLILLPEMFNTGFTVEPERIAEAPGGEVPAWMHRMARETGSVVAGSYIVREQNQYYNRLLWMWPDGSFKTYDKRHLFRMANEHLRFQAGRQKLVVELKGWKICPLICYDLRFPVWSKNTYKAGEFQYDLLVYVANWPEARSGIWTALLRARAIENLSYVAGVNRVGTDPKGISYSGDSLVVDFEGNTLQTIAPGLDSEITVSLSANQLREFRSHFNAGLDWDEFEIAP